MDLSKFHGLRKPFYLDSDTLLVKFPNQKFMNSSHAEWFNEFGIPWLHTIRGYYYENEDCCYVMLYWNDFAIPNITVGVCTYLFEYFPKAEWIGLGCNIGNTGDIWTPKLTVYKSYDLSSK